MWAHDGIFVFAFLALIKDFITFAHRYYLLIFPMGAHAVGALNVLCDFFYLYFFFKGSTEVAPKKKHLTLKEPSA
jgi:hypothetical protein